MPDLLIRPATADDIPAIAQRLAAMVQAMEQMGGFRAAPFATVVDLFQGRIRERLQRDTFCYQVAEFDGAIVGITEASIIEMGGVFEPRWILHIHGIYVDESARRQGIGQQLMESALVWGREHGCDLAELNVLVNNPARYLYEQTGFQMYQYQMSRRL